MKQETKGPGPYLLSLFFVPVLLFNLIFLVYPFIVEGKIIGDVLPVSELDAWIVSHLFGGFTYDRYVTALFASYVLSLLVGFLFAWALLSPTFRELVKNRQVVVSERLFGAKAVVDILVTAIVVVLVLDPVLAYVLGYPQPLPSITFVSFISAFALTGFVTGNGITKSFFPLQIYLMCRRNNLMINAFYVEASSETEKRSTRSIQWVLADKANDTQWRIAQFKPINRRME